MRGGAAHHLVHFAEPVVLAQEKVKVEQVVGRERRTVVGFEQLGRTTPDLHADAR